MSRRRINMFLTATLYLLSQFVLCDGTAASENEEYAEIIGLNSSPLILGMSICALKADPGPCKALHTRYHFNIHTRHCELFNFGGCQGNKNNFLTLDECQETCVVKDVQEKTKKSRLKNEKPSFCLLENDPGICRGLIARYFYNKVSQQCEKFQYGGCLGNQNNFQSLQECQKTCHDRVPSTNSLQIDDDHTVLGTISNNSAPLIKQELSLLPSLCVMPMDRGLCKANEKRFFYNQTAGRCRPFSYTGCGGNENNFTSRKACVQMCMKGFISKKGQKGVRKIRRKRKKQLVKVVDGEIVIERI
ncbi:tissue factor pathway inhibitor isoform X1 [Ahaetulla prasina]|uniref:tissue factor pathway inhibitor isoform X1 n=1 Tax=Ahaetulla prasina TaxID=499056 RepID=UPI002647DAF2|nr:tissue factor pathway inhibitor isoform X1 [Ahaetulla prasina]XP_058045036.1 tissue factor pathway inhibitor isoform X1 [Ahaetulla prasina]XP_058045043.1 tissue factor pathway inhibitor isoform X1 [Ahaetulla prasina]XP_058045052.1 tissue factor pathway inhibitor isoform X1 [Ahaetulla prasina]XP_058045059.1 tissue factor pathway inhibitor isoform X1 [Ahaetulla prasina]XP_058045069.1 tissue factor pathway inhibitor isoform X1 [Ahaetulla prasina]XP_058045076.1 tissue factor pathway inhibitor 